MRWIMGVIVALSLANVSYASGATNSKKNAVGYNVDVIRGISYRRFLTDEVALEVAVRPSLRKIETEEDSLSAERTERGVDLIVDAMKIVAASDHLRLNVGAGFGYSYSRDKSNRSDKSRQTVRTLNHYLLFGYFGIEVFTFKDLSVEARLGCILSRKELEEELETEMGGQARSSIEDTFSFFRNDIDILKPLRTVSVRYYF